MQLEVDEHDFGSFGPNLLNTRLLDGVVCGL